MNGGPKPQMNDARLNVAALAGLTGGANRKMAELRITLIDYDDTAVITLKQAIEKLLPDRAKANIVVTIR